jgi:3-hydroxy-9,10-secoandrosta-1,3,5(10)-triene-9,17-dione monooxygenase reductase component
MADTSPDQYRHVLGHFATGITVITTVSGGTPAGFTCQSFGALSLDPPLVLFCPGKSSATGQRIIDAGRFCANVLAESQRDLARGFASKAADKFADVNWAPSPAGLPLLAGAHAWVDADVEAVHDGGDHHVVIGRVTALGVGAASDPPLLFYRGRFTLPEPERGSPEIVDTLLAWARPDDWM